MLLLNVRCARARTAGNWIICLASCFEVKINHRFSDQAGLGLEAHVKTVVCWTQDGRTC
jgi:hypothetical protein